jgi:hypothetical protein
VGRARSGYESDFFDDDDDDVGGDSTPRQWIGTVLGLDVCTIGFQL